MKYDDENEHKKRERTFDLDAPEGPAPAPLSGCWPKPCL